MYPSKSPGMAGMVAFRSLVLGALLALFSLPAASGSASGYALQIRVQDQNGDLIPARVHVVDGAGYSQPDHADSTLLCRYDYAMGSYFYVDHPITLNLVPGVARITAGRGFEWKPSMIYFNVQSDTTAVLTLNHSFDLRQEGWYSGDKHFHTRHPPLEYNIDPAALHRLALCEDLSMSWALDQTYHFIGAPDPVSTPDAVIYYATEWRNQAYGHVALLGLKQWIGQECCTPPWDAYPMLSDIRDWWHPGWDEAMSLNHPHSTSDFMMDTNWPGWGLGRETPVLAAMGNLDSYDIASYTNVGYVWTQDWYGLLNCGFHIPPSAGTDAVANAYFGAPFGGYRVYVKETVPHDASHWVEGLKAGRVFVTNYPLIPIFTVDGAEAGSVLDRSGASATVTVHMKVESTLPVSTVNLVRNGQVVGSYPIPWDPNGTVWETTTSVTFSQSSWLALQVTGTTNVPHSASHSLFAHTGAVYVDLNGHSAQSPSDAGRFLDWIDSLRVFVDQRGQWEPGAEQAVHQRLDAARAAYSHIFSIPPQAPALLAPSEGDSVSSLQPLAFDWSDATDPEPGDTVHYDFDLAPDSTFSQSVGPDSLAESACVLATPPIYPSHLYYWRVWAIDRGGNRTLCTPRWQWFYFDFPASSAIGGSEESDPLPPGGAGSVRLSVWPNPSSGPFHLSWAGPGTVPWRMEIFDAGGRMVRRVLLGERAGASTPPATTPRVSSRETFWDGRDLQGRTVPAGLYWVCWPQEGPASGGSHSGTAKATIVIVR